MKIYSKPPPPPPPPKPQAPAPAAAKSVAPRASSFQSSFEPARRSAVVLQPDAPASTLRTERLGDGQANCLERAFQSAKPGDSVVLFNDSRDGVGHAVVQHPDGSVSDPNEPGRSYGSLAEWQKAHSGYGSPVPVPQTTLAKVFSVPPGPERDAALKAAGLGGVANRAVADRYVPGMLGYLHPTQNVNCRRSPGDTSDASYMGTFPKDTLLVVTPLPEGVQPVEGWAYVTGTLPDGTQLTGWVSTDPQWMAQGVPDNGGNPAAPINPGTGGGGTPETGGTPAAGGPLVIDGTTVTRSAARNPTPGASIADRTPRYSQGDSLWSSVGLWPGGPNVRDSGCGVTGEAMILSALSAQQGGGPVSPQDVIGAGGGDFVSTNTFDINGQTYQRQQQPFSTATIDAELTAGRPVLLQVNGGSHYVVVVGKNPDGSYQCYDPGYRTQAAAQGITGSDTPCDTIRMVPQPDGTLASDPARWTSGGGDVVYTFSAAS